jgi:predicted dehydrogenase
MSKARVGIIGCGKFAEAQHMPNCRKAENVELYCCSSRSEKGRDTALRYGAQKVTADYKEILNDPAVDFVILSVPHEMHLFYIKEVLSAGKHLLCEKPMTMTMAEAYEVVRLTKSKKLKLCVDYNRRFSPAMVDMKKAYQAHKKGPRGKARVYTQENNRPTWSEENQTMMLVRINDESATYGGVHIDWREGGGQIIGEGCHWLDLICWMLEQRPVRVTAAGSTRLNYVINIEFADGSLGCLFFCASGSFEYPKELVEIQDHGKIFRSECFVENHYFGLGERTVKTFPLQFDFYPEEGKQGGMAGYLQKIDAMGTEYAQTGNLKYVFPDKGHFDLLKAFADAVIDDRPSPLDEVAGTQATYLSQRAMDSIRLGAPLPVNIEDWEMYVHV